jgi:hypothetical protein
MWRFPMKEKCTHEEPRSSPPTYEDNHWNSRNAIDWNCLSAELGFVFWLWDCCWTSYVLEEGEDMLL